MNSDNLVTYKYLVYLKFQDLSEVITRLDAIESKLDILIKQSKGKKYPEAVTDSPTPISKKEVSLN